MIVHEDKAHSSRPKRSTAGKGVSILDPSFQGKRYTKVQRRWQAPTRKNGRSGHSFLQQTVGVLFTQMHAYKGLELFGEKAVEALMVEFAQLDNGVMEGKPVIEPISINDITENEQAKALNS